MEIRKRKQIKPDVFERSLINRYPTICTRLLWSDWWKRVAEYRLDVFMEGILEYTTNE